MGGFSEGDSDLDAELGPDDKLDEDDGFAVFHGFLSSAFRFPFSSLMESRGSIFMADSCIEGSVYR